MIRVTCKDREANNTLDNRDWMKISVDGLDAEVYVMKGIESMTEFTSVYFIKNGRFTCIQDRWIEEEMTDEDWESGIEPDDIKTNHIKDIDRFVKLYREVA